MNNFGDKVSFIWSVADLLRGPYRPNQYKDVMLPLTVLRRLDCVLEKTKDKVLATHGKWCSKGAGILEAKLDKTDRLFLVISRFCEIDFHPDTISNIEMGYIFKELIRKFNKASNEEAGDYFIPRKVLPHVPDAWVDENKTKVGYEINFNRYFYEYTPPRPLDEIESDLKQVEDEIANVLLEVSK